MSDNTSKFLRGILGDISNRSAYSQLIIGATTGWFTGFTTMKFGKFTAFAIGGSIILLEIAHQEGIIKVNWLKLSESVDKVADKVESSVTGREKNWIDKTERYMDRKIDKVDNLIQGKAKGARKWYSKLIGDEDGPKINDLHIFLTAFVGGVAIGIATA